MTKFTLWIGLVMLSMNFYAQEKIDGVEVENQTTSMEFDMDPLAPTKATFYSVVLPGLGQAYNKKYWMIPVIYGALGVPAYFYKKNNDRYNQFLDAYKLSLVGKPHEFSHLDKSGLERGINGYKRNRDISLFLGIGVYVLNILEANVDAHLPNNPIDTNISYKPMIQIDPITNTISYGATVSYRF